MERLMDKVFEVLHGRVVDEWAWDYEAGRWRKWEDDTGEFADCADGWYWQWRSGPYPYDVMGEAGGKLHGPFPDRVTAAHEVRSID